MAARYFAELSSPPRRTGVGRGQMVTMMYWHRRLRVPASNVPELKNTMSPSLEAYGLFGLSDPNAPVSCSIEALWP